MARREIRGVASYVPSSGHAFGARLVSHTRHVSQRRRALHAPSPSCGRRSHQSSSVTCVGCAR
eukprot:4040717-Pleurochrysis_carterae.AAC.1